MTFAKMKISESLNLRYDKNDLTLSNSVLRVTLQGEHSVLAWEKKGHVL